MARRALIAETELRRWATVVREEGVAIRSKIDPTGVVTITITSSATGPVNDDVDDLNERLTAYGSS